MQPGRVPKAQRGGGRNSESSVPPPTEPGVLRPAIIKSESSRGRCWEGGRWKDYFKKSLENLFEEKMDLLPPPAGPEIPPPAVTHEAFPRFSCLHAARGDAGKRV